MLMVVEVQVMPVEGVIPVHIINGKVMFLQDLSLE
jgi:hypothetical protein